VDESAEQIATAKAGRLHRLLGKLDITEAPESNRRVLAVLTYLRSN
jgi:hypothetical protein